MDERAKVLEAVRRYRNVMEDDRISKDGQRAKCRACGEWYGLDEYHGMFSPTHIAWELQIALYVLDDDTITRGVQAYVSDLKAMAIDRAVRATTAGGA